MKIFYHALHRMETMAEESWQDIHEHIFDG